MCRGYWCGELYGPCYQQHRRVEGPSRRASPLKAAMRVERDDSIAPLLYPALRGT